MADNSDKPAEPILSIIKSVANERSTSAGNMAVVRSLPGCPHKTESVL
jgi:hypothetical protein